MLGCLTRSGRSAAELAGTGDTALARVPRTGRGCCARACDAPQVSLDLNLPAKLVLHPCLRQLTLEEHLQRDDEVRLLLAREVDLAELAVAERLADVEVIERPLALWRSSAASLRSAFRQQVSRADGLAAGGQHAPHGFPLRPAPRP